MVICNSHAMQSVRAPLERVCLCSGAHKSKGKISRVGCGRSTLNGASRAKALGCMTQELQEEATRQEFSGQVPDISQCCSRISYQSSASSLRGEGKVSNLEGPSCKKSHEQEIRAARKRPLSSVSHSHCTPGFSLYEYGQPYGLVPVTHRSRASKALLSTN